MTASPAPTSWRLASVRAEIDALFTGGRDLADVLEDAAASPVRPGRGGPVHHREVRVTKMSTMKPSRSPRHLREGRGRPAAARALADRLVGAGQPEPTDDGR